MAAKDQKHLVDSIKECIEKKSNLPYVKNYIESPVVDEDLILMMSAAMEGSSLHYEERQAAAAAAMLVQIALETHEMVNDPQATLKQRQLLVLAGDFLSGQYYGMLAGSDDIHLIKTLAEAIQNINERKIIAWQGKIRNPEMYMQNYKKIETAILENFCIHFQAYGFVDVFTDFLFVKRMHAELKKGTRNDSSLFLDGLADILSRAEKSEGTESAINGKIQAEQFILAQIGKMMERIERELSAGLQLPALLSGRFMDELEPYTAKRRLRTGER